MKRVKIKSEEPTREVKSRHQLQHEVQAHLVATAHQIKINRILLDDALERKDMRAISRLIHDIQQLSQSFAVNLVAFDLNEVRAR